MKKFILIFFVFVTVATKAQTIRTFYVDSTHITSNWPAPPLPCPSDTSFFISDGDTLYFINKLSTSMFNVWINDSNFTGSPTYGTGSTPINDTITRIAVINNTSYHILGDNNFFYGSISQFPNICLLNGTADFGRRYFITHSNTNNISDFDFTNSILIYPVPTSKYLSVMGIAKTQTNFYIFDLSGTLIKQGMINESNIDVEYLSTGTYFIKFFGIEKSYKFIKN